MLRTDAIDAIVLRAKGKATLHHSMQRRAQRRLRVVRMQVARALHAAQHGACGHVGAGGAPAGGGASLRLRRPASVGSMSARTREAQQRAQAHAPAQRGRPRSSRGRHHCSSSRARARTRRRRRHERRARRIRRLGSRRRNIGLHARGRKAAATGGGKCRRRVPDGRRALARRRCTLRRHTRALRGKQAGAAHRRLAQLVFCAAFVALRDRERARPVKKQAWLQAAQAAGHGARQARRRSGQVHSSTHAYR